MNYNYTVASYLENAKADVVYSNTNLIQINYADLISTGNFVKRVGAANSSICDVLTYAITIHNTGNTEALNITVQDIIPIGGKFISHSYLMNGILHNTAPDIGIVIPQLSVGQYCVISFEVQIIGQPFPNPMENIATLSYEYLVDPTLSILDTRVGESNVAKTLIQPSSTLDN